MIILVLNSGSSSLKYQLFDTDKNFRVLAKGLIERIGLEMSAFTYKYHNVDGKLTEKAWAEAARSTMS